MTTALKIVCWVTGIFGVITAGVCIWLFADPIEVVPGITTGIGNSPKVAIAAAVLMILMGICSFFIDVEKRFPYFAGFLFLVLILAITFMSIAISDHQEMKKAQKIIKVNTQGFSTYPGNRNREAETFAKGFLKLTEDIIEPMMTRLKVVAAVGGIDSVVLLICIILFLVKRPKHSSRNTMQMERKL